MTNFWANTPVCQSAPLGLRFNHNQNFKLLSWISGKMACFLSNVHSGVMKWPTDYAHYLYQEYIFLSIENAFDYLHNTKLNTKISFLCVWVYIYANSLRKTDRRVSMSLYNSTISEAVLAISIAHWEADWSFQEWDL